MMRIIVCEGWATGRTLAEHEPGAMVIAAIDAGNLQAIAVQARLRWPTADLVLAADDDRLTPNNPGVSRALAAACASGARVILPDWPTAAPKYLSDFNDLANWYRGQQ